MRHQGTRSLETAILLGTTDMASRKLSRWTSPSVLVLCHHCKMEFKRPPSRLKRVKHSHCSRACATVTRVSELKARGHFKKNARLGHKGWTKEGRKKWLQSMTGPNNPAWKGGVTYFRKHGNYKPIKYVRCPPEFLAMARKDRYVMEHRLIMAKVVGHPLTQTEVVHHVNHDPHDNRPENLELWPDNRTHKLWERGVNVAEKRLWPILSVVV